MYSVTDFGVLKKIETWQVILPLYNNAGEPFSEDTIEAILDFITLNFPGLTMVSCTGRWRGEERTHIDKNLQVLSDALPISTEQSGAFFSNLKADLQYRLGQEKIYVTKESSKEEMISFDEFFREIGVELEIPSESHAKKTMIQQIVGRLDFVMQRMGYETISIRRDRETKKFTWERRLCGIRLLSVLEDSYPDDAVLVGADQFDLLSRYLFTDSCVIVGHYEFQKYAVARTAIKPLVRSTLDLASHYECPRYLSPEGANLNVRQFVERFTMAIVSNIVVLRDHGFLPDEISINVGRDGAMQTTKGKLGTCLFINPAGIPDECVQQEIIRCVRQSCEQLESNTIDHFSLQQAKALNFYVLRRAMLKQNLPQTGDQ